MSKTIEISPGQVVEVKDHPIPGQNTQCLVLYPIDSNALEVIPYDGKKLIGRIGGGIPALDIIKVLNRLPEATYISLIVAAGVGREVTARTVYNRRAISYDISP